MRRATMTGLVLGLIVAAAPAPLRADDKADMLKNLYAKLARIITGGDPNATNMLILSCPGFSVPATGLDVSNNNDMVFLAKTLNAIPNPNPFYSASRGTYTEIYGRIMAEKALDPPTLSEAERATLTAAMNHVSRKNKDMIEYTKYRKAFNLAQAAVNSATNALNKKMGERVDSTLLEDVREARENWIKDGKKNEIEAELNTIRELSNRGGGPWWNELEANYQDMKTQMKAGTPAVDTYPPAGNWGTKDSEGNPTSSWTTFTWSASENTKDSSYSSKEMEAASAYSSGAISVRAEGGFNKLAQDASAADKKMTISVSLMRVGVYRSWLDMSIFEMTNWSFPDMLSNGDPTRPAGLMPLMINEILLAKDLQVSGDWAKKSASKKELSFHVGVEGSFGPFSMSAKYAQKDTSASNMAAAGSESIVNPDVQVIGFICSPLPKAPNWSRKPR